MPVAKLISLSENSGLTRLVRKDMSHICTVSDNGRNLNGLDTLPISFLRGSPSCLGCWRRLFFFREVLLLGQVDFLSLLPNTFLATQPPVSERVSLLHDNLLRSGLSLLLKAILATHWPAVWRLDFWVKLILFLFYPTPSLQRTGQTKVALLNVYYSEPFPRRILADVRWRSQTS